MHSWLSRCLLLMACSWTANCSSLVTEPRPDIPEVPEESTVLLEWGDEETFAQTMALSTQMLVGDEAKIARLTDQTIIATNDELRQNLTLIQTITETPIDSYDDGVWQWELQEEDWVYRFTISTATERDTYEYLLLAGENADALQETLRGTMTSFQRRDGNQQAYGQLTFAFDDSHPRSTRGTAHVRFRRLGGVRQVNVGLSDYNPQPGTEMDRNALYNFLLLPDRSGRFGYQTQTNAFGRDAGTIGVDVAFTRLGSGRGVAILPPKENINGDRVELEECWDGQRTVTFQTSTPADPLLIDGDREDCPPSLADLELEPPTQPDGTLDMASVPVPPKHPQEED